MDQSICCFLSEDSFPGYQLTHISEAVTDQFLFQFLIYRAEGTGYLRNIAGICQINGIVQSLLIISSQHQDKELSAMLETGSGADEVAFLIFPEEPLIRQQADVWLIYSIQVRLPEIKLPYCSAKGKASWVALPQSA